MSKVVGYLQNGTPIYDGDEDSSSSTPPPGSHGPNQNGSSADAKNHKAIDLIERVGRANQQALLDKFNNSMDMYNISDEQIKKLGEDQTKANATASADDFFKQLINTQSAAEQLKGAAGNAMRGSNLYNIWDLLERQNNNANAETLKTQRENQNKIFDEMFEKLAANVNARNEAGVNTEFAKQQVAHDLMAQIATIDPDYAEGKMDTWEGEGRGFYNEHKTPAAEHQLQGLYTEDNAQQKANKLMNQSKSIGSTNNNYWNNLKSNYKKRY